MKPTLTVFTPTYNRAHTLGRVYESLCRQTSADFCWLIIDDGSSDNTKDIVKIWQNKPHNFAISYEYKENGGLHTGYNKAIELIDTELCVCIDSDDYMPDDAVEIALAMWKQNGSEEYAGLIGLDYTMDGNVVGGLLPEIKSIHLYEMQTKYTDSAGDKKCFMRTDLLKMVAPQPTYEGERNFNPYYMMLKIDFMRPFLVLNKNLCYVDYQTDGMGNNLYFQYRNSPFSFMELRRLYMQIPNAPLSFVIRQHIHYVSSAIFAKDLSQLSKSGAPILSFMLFPFGLLLNGYIRYRTK